MTTMTTKQYKLGLFIFHRDLRIEDNKGLTKMIKQCDKVFPIFIFTHQQIDARDNKFKSFHSVRFLIEALSDLKERIPSIQFFYGDYGKVIETLVSEFSIDVVGFNQDITPFAISRTNHIKKLYNTICEDDYYLCDFKNTSVLQSEDKPYVKFSAFHKRALEHLKKEKHRLSVEIERSVFNKKNYLVLDKIENRKVNALSISLKNAYIKFLSDGDDGTDVYNTTMDFWDAYRENALSILKSIKNGEHKSYDKQRNTLMYQTTQLSAFIKYGLVSIREVAAAMKGNHALFRQLLWRDFYAIIMYYIPRVLKEPFQEKYKKLNWTNNARWNKAWCNGRTGFPVVDACMTQLNESGYMHNRGRLIVSSFLVKLLQTNWQYGEHYFATKLVDYDPCSNNGNWQWVAGTGTDMMPYFRIFNPWTQSLKYDPDCVFIKQWLPQLSSIPPEHLHQWDKYCTQYDLNELNYIEPIVDYKAQRKKAFQMYKRI